MKNKNNCRYTQSSQRTKNPRYEGSQIYTTGHCTPETPLAEKLSFPKGALDPPKYL